MWGMSGTRKTPIFRKLFYVLAGVGVAGVCWWLSDVGRGREEVRDAQRAEPMAQPVARVLGGLILLRAEELVTAPEVDGFQWPCGAPSGAMVYDAQPFGAMNEKRHGHHTGEDLNGIGGENTDLGVEVSAAGRGLVVYSGKPSAEWGNVVVLAHRIPKERGVIQTLYAHLDTRDVRVGQMVSRGQRVGSIGTADGKYLAHLHFEVIRSQSTEAGMRGYHPTGTMNRVDPAKLLAEYPAPPIPDPFAEVRRIRSLEAGTRESERPTELPGEPGVIPVTPQHYLTP